MGCMHVLRPDPDEPWLDVVKRALGSSFHHLPAYHKLHEGRGEGKAHLFLYNDGCYFVAVPLLVREIVGEADREQRCDRWHDATSVYGYAGPISSHIELPVSVRRNFSAALKATLEELRVVSVFSRLAPHSSQLELLNGLGRCKHEGFTVSIDLTMPLDAQRAQYRTNHRRDIDKLRRRGVTCRQDRDRAYLEQFIAMYHETMQRVNASEYYFFDTTYFADLLASPYTHLFVCSQEGSVICGGIFTLYDHVVEYHLGATSNQAQGPAPLKLLIDDVCVWGHHQGARLFHLGGGVGAREDSLFHFKAGFSHKRHAFYTWRWVVLPDVYEQLCSHAHPGQPSNNGYTLTSGYFPAYRDLNHTGL